MPIKKKQAQKPSYEVIHAGTTNVLLANVEPSQHNVLRVTLSDGRAMDIELWEREPGRLSIRGLYGRLVVRPQVSNVITVSVEG